MAGPRLPVPRLAGVSQEQFMQQFYPQRKPLVLEGIDLGECTSKWTVDYLSQVGGRKEVKIHVAAVAQMDFITLWFHNVISEEFGVGVNVFWRHLPSECYDKTDTYGNKDPTAASRAAQILDRALKTLAELPEEYRDFYARRMVLHIQDKAYSKNFE
uniref:tRNA-yW synthesizing protein 5 n=1 Tax=Equus asinus TaxID=9793 RepID=A0A9L0IIR2_EQUAS